MLLLLSSRHGEPSEARCAPWRCLCRCTCFGKNECAFHRNITKWVSLALSRGRHFCHSSMKGWNSGRHGCLVEATRCGRPPDGGHAGPPLRNTSLRTWMPAIHAGTTNAVILTFWYHTGSRSIRNGKICLQERSSNDARDRQADAKSRGYRKGDRRREV